ncbi:hypothetical protein R1flu_026710 [Riccia fluitans]|uniref:Uncharacterized protein n=1 Tax=Riccia fluitans TaxID=41844 RepID=A0ABD1XGQ3_9MARC
MAWLETAQLEGTSSNIVDGSCQPKSNKGDACGNGCGEGSRKEPAHFVTRMKIPTRNPRGQHARREHRMEWGKYLGRGGKELGMRKQHRTYVQSQTGVCLEQKGRNAEGRQWYGSDT